MIAVGIVLARPQDDPRQWLGDAVAFEAAGADALWMDHGRSPRLDPLVLTAALAALTYRALLVTAMPQPHAEALSTIAFLSRDRFALIGEAGVRRLDDGAYQAEAGRWSPVPVPQGRAAWRETVRLAMERGDHGVLVPADPRLLDLLRNPDDPGGRQDLQLAQG